MNPTEHHPHTRTRRRLKAQASASASASAAATTPLQRLRGALDLLRQERAPGGDYHPADDEILGDWDATKRHCQDEHALALDHLDQFVRVHHGTLRDLMWRARHGHAPTRFLDELALAIAGQLARVRA